jgi:hypothetical protein
VSRVRLVKLTGSYDKGKTKQNRAEASAVVAEIVGRLSDENLRGESIGVVTFSSAQQTLIADLLDEAFRSRPDLDEFNSSAAEPVFVKNLENVQGDERDVILFSIGYGPDQDGKVALNFGPLNRDGGWRRLNVAVSRARREMVVFSVLEAQQIDLNRTRSEGLAGLKAFLEFAEQGKSALPPVPGEKRREEGFEEQVAKRIRGLGYEVFTNIGCSGFKVDIGVVNSERPDEYALGVMCDGKGFYGSGTARDRSIIQESMLKSLGWRLHRAWTLDWWEDEDNALQKLEEAIKEAILASPKIEPPKLPKTLNFDTIAVSAEKPFEEYRQAILPVEDGNASLFTNPISKEKIKGQVKLILEAEAPISLNVLSDRLLGAWGMSRSGSRISRIIEEILSELGAEKTSGNKGFYWPSGSSLKLSSFRVPAETGYKRPLEDVPPEEVALAAKHLADLMAGLSVRDLCKEMAKLFGYSKCSAATLAVLEPGIRLAEGLGLIARQGEWVASVKG